MMKRRHYMDDSLIEPPVNAEENSVKFNFEKDAYNEDGTPKLALSITALEFARENNDKILKHYNDGLILRGKPYRYEIERSGKVEKIFNGFLDLTDNAIFGREKSTVNAKQLFGIDSFSDQANGLSFEYLYSIGVITSDDFKFMPYVLNKIPDYQEAAITILSGFYLTQEITKAVNTITDLATDTANPFTTPNAIVKAIVYVLYLSILLAAIVLLIKKIVLYIIQPVKYHAVMNIKTILTKSCAHLGYTFKCDLFDKAPFDKLVFMPEKFYNPIQDYKENGSVLGQTFGFIKPQKILQRGYPSGFLGDFIREVKKLYRRKIVIDVDRNIFLIPEYKNTGSPQYKMPPVEQYEFTTNANELKSNRVFSFQTDSEDKNTIHQYKGTYIQVVTRFKTAVPQKLSLLKEVEETEFGFALAKRKEALTLPETIIKGYLDGLSIVLNVLIKGVNILINAVNSIINTVKKVIKILKKIGIDIPFNAQGIPFLNTVDFGNIIENRIGMMMIETDITTVPKLFLMDEGTESKFNKISPLNATVVSARYLYENHHKPCVSFLPSADRPNGAQCIIKKFEQVPFVYEDFLNVINNNNIFTSDSKDAIIEDGEWFDGDERASYTARISHLYIPASEIEEVLLEPDGR